jgi:hypothetical protein
MSIFDHTSFKLDRKTAVKDLEDLNINLNSEQIEKILNYLSFSLPVTTTADNIKCNIEKFEFEYSSDNIATSGFNFKVKINDKNFWDIAELEFPIFSFVNIEKQEKPQIKLKICPGIHSF